MGAGRILRRSEGRPCSYCGVSMTRSTRGARDRRATRDHAVIPRVYGGTLKRSNVVICCSRCNREKGSSPIGAWIVALRAAEDPRAELVAAVWSRLSMMQD